MRIERAKRRIGLIAGPVLAAVLFVGSFFIVEAMRLHGLGDRLGRAMIRRARGRLSMLITTVIEGHAGPWTAGERAVVISIAVAIIGWLTPPLLVAIGPDTAIA